MASKIDPIAPLTWVAIDVAKGMNVALVERPDGRQHRLRFAHCREDYDRFADFLHQLPSPCRVAVEPTADYHRTLAFFLLKQGFDVVFVSSVAGARLREATFNSWDKNDPKDAQVILRLLKLGMTQRYCDPLLAQTHDLQELSKTYHHIACVRTRLQHLLVTHYLTLYFPELEWFWSTQRNDWFVRFLMRFPTPESIRKLDLQTFKKIVSEMMGRRVHKDAKIAEIYSLAERSIALPVPEHSLAVATLNGRSSGICEALVPSQVYTSGTITALRNHTLLCYTASLQGVSILQLSTPFTSGCNWFFLNASDKNALAVVLEAKASNSPVTVYYDSAVTSPWGDPTTCGVVAIEVD